MQRFSQRHGLRHAPAEITFRHEAPDHMRNVIVDIAVAHGLRPIPLRALLCRILCKRPAADNWMEHPDVELEVRDLMAECAWFEAYDAIEAIAAELLWMGRAYTFERDVNLYFERAGIGWKLVSGRMEVRGSETFETAIAQAKIQLTALGKANATSELHEAIVSLSKRPTPEVSEAIRHAITALECMVRESIGSKDAWGALVSRNRDLFPHPLDTVVEQAWGWTTSLGRRLQEGQTPTFEEAELAVGISGILCRYLSRTLALQRNLGSP